jgi:hypothetical protein
MTLPTDRALTPEELREWLDRSVEDGDELPRPWTLWFEWQWATPRLGEPSVVAGAYLGTSSARTGPDEWATAEQKCSCAVCSKSETEETHGEPEPEP